MKSNYFFLFLFCCAFHFAAAQTNLVPNPSFEQYSQCPDGLDQMNRCVGWSSYSTTPDYYHTCSVISGLAPPSSSFGYQWPHSGNAYAGVINFHINYSNYREFIGTQLISPLQAGEKYFISFWVNLGGQTGATIASDKMGVHFSTTPYSVSTPAPINNNPHFSYNTIITDTANWTLIQGSFTSNAAYEYITLGNFFNDSLTDTVNLAPQFNYTAYYYIDDVCVSTDSLYSLNWWTGIYNTEVDKEIRVYPNPSSNEVNIEFMHDLPLKVSLINSLGVTAVEQHISSHQRSLKIMVAHLPRGFYTLRFEYPGFTTSRKIIVANP